MSSSVTPATVPLVPPNRMPAARAIAETELRNMVSSSPRSLSYDVRCSLLRLQARGARIQPGADRPHRLLTEDALELRHLFHAILLVAVARELDEPLVAVGAGLEIAQVRGDAAGHCVDAVAAGTILRIAVRADLDGERITAIGVFGQPFVAERRQAGRVDLLWGDVAVTECCEVCAVG